MIPLRLQLKNFLSYGPQEQTINFEPYHLICLSGKNGHGKSALLDAMTWTIWGQARKTSGTAKADSDILRIGQTFMMVTFDFSFNNNTYRIKREYAKTFAKPYASLDFGILDPNNQKIKSLTEKTIRGTQEKIEKTIGLDYETFINTAFLRQGHANEFSKKSPQERKDILASILNLHQYENIRKQAQEKTKEACAKEQHLKENQQKLKEELEKKDIVIQELTASTQNYNTLLQHELECIQKQKELEKQQNQLNLQFQEFHILMFKYEQLIKQEEEKKAEIRSLFAVWRSINSQLRILPDRIELENEKKKLQEILKKEQTAFQDYLQTKESYLQVKEKEQFYSTQIKEIHQKNIHEQKIIIERLYSHKEALITQVKLYQNYKEKTGQELVALENKKLLLEKKCLEYKANKISNFEQIFEKRKAHYHMWISRLNYIHNEQKQLVQKQQFTHDTDNPSCPLCEQNLSASRKSFLKTKFSELERFYAHRRTRLEKATKKLKDLLIKQHTELQLAQEQQKDEQLTTATLNEIAKNYSLLEQNLKEFTHKYQEAIKTIKDCEEKYSLEQAKLHQLENNTLQLINNDTQYQAFNLQLKKLEFKIKENPYNAVYHEQIIKKLEEIEKKLDKYEVLIQEQAGQEQRKKSIFSLIYSLKEQKRETKLLIKKQASFSHIKQEQNNLKNNQEQLIREFKNLQENKEILLGQKGRLEQQKIYFERLQTDYINQEKKLKELKYDIFEYSAISLALSKNGVQALLIEDTIPEIEHEANILLGQLTDNQTHIIIESVRDLKKGGTRETLDINISDPMGIRPYELFSGGEAFRIDFALRIAISKLLARRAGTSLQTLIIDEGFGSQDEEGLSRLMDALYKIQDNFCKVIIVSHLPALKDQFPVHFVIAKGPQGSTLQVVEQG